MTTKGPLSRFAFYWNEQRGRCALMITEACRTHGGQMITERPKGAGKKRQFPGQPTWDHVYPKPRDREQEPVQLLACAACNNARGSRAASASYIALGERLLDEWRAGEQKRNRVLSPKTAKRRRRYAEKLGVTDERFMPPQVPERERPPIERRVRNAESQAAALNCIAERMAKMGRHKHALQVTEKAANILAAVRGKPPERK